MTKEQEKLVYSQESRAKLEAEPVEITLGDVTLPLEHLDRNRLPGREHLFGKIMSNSKSPEDWENVLRCMEGFEEAGIKKSVHAKESVVRKLNLAGMQHIVLKGLQRVKDTGLSMRVWVVTRQVLRGLHDKAAGSGWDKDETAKAFKMAKQVVELMEHDQHCGREPLQYDHRGRPEVIALPTELAAVMAERHGGDIEEVKTMCRRLVAALEQSDYMVCSLSFITKRARMKTNTRLTDYARCSFRAFTNFALRI